MSCIEAAVLCCDACNLNYTLLSEEGTKINLKKLGNVLRGFTATYGFMGCNRNAQDIYDPESRLDIVFAGGVHKEG